MARKCPRLVGSVRCVILLKTFGSISLTEPFSADANTLMEAVATTMLSSTIQKKVATSSFVFEKKTSEVNYY
jgi:hypothetical protein